MHELDNDHGPKVENKNKYVEEKEMLNKIGIMGRPQSSDEERKSVKIRPFHERLRDYIKVRTKIFSDAKLGAELVRKYKRSTVRMRNFYKKIKYTKRLFVSSIINCEKDGRLYAEVKFLDREEFGLLDSGANISCIGDELANLDYSNHPSFRKIKSIVKTADGKSQSVVGELKVDMTYKNLVRTVTLYVVPTLNQKLILGLDFWRSFGLMSNIISGLSLTNHEANISGNIDSEFIPLSKQQQQQLEIVKSLFPNFELQGLGRTALIKHKIDVGEARPVKQRFYPVSPAVEKLMFTEVDRMLSLGVIEPSFSAWSSPMRMVIKPGKIRLCLDARKINEVTKKDA